MKNLTKNQIIEIAREFGLEPPSVTAVLEVESGGLGFCPITGKIIIQFEPVWFRRKSPYTPSGLWSQNGVDRQAAEWRAFNDAYAKDSKAALESTSIGLMQVMGFNHKICGFKTVGLMWDYAKESEANQLRLGLRFIKANTKMFTALKENDFATFAFYYNGAKYKMYNYDVRLHKAYMAAVEKYND